MHFVNRFVNSVMPLPDVTALSDDDQPPQTQPTTAEPSAAVVETPKPELKPKSAAKKAPQAPKVKKVPAANMPLKRPAAAMDSEMIKRPAASEKAPARAYKSMYKNGVWGIKFGGREVVRAARTQTVCLACVFLMLFHALPCAAIGSTTRSSLWMVFRTKSWPRLQPTTEHAFGYPLHVCPTC